MAVLPSNSFLAIIGFILSAYSVYVEQQIHLHRGDDGEGVDEFKALCDIDAIGASCR